MNDRFDVVVIGAGIHGAGVAQAAAARGLSVLVLEKTAPAAGTSSRSSKLIHGGLRYLESGQFSLVRECLRERELLLRLAPQLVRRVKFYIPIYEETSRRPWEIFAGLSIYAALCGFRKECLFRRVPRSEWNNLDGLQTDRLRAVFEYSDAQTDDKALTNAVLRSAQSLGAEIRVPAEFLGATLLERGVDIRYLDGGVEKACECRAVVNAAGPWIIQTAALFNPQLTLPAIELVQGTHIVIDTAVQRGVYYLEAGGDRRAVFVMPWQGHVMVGTTETKFSGSPDRVQPLQSEIDYLMECYCKSFRTSADPVVIESFAGLRVLPGSEGAVFTRPRDTTLAVDRQESPRVVTIIGGKLTAYRATAQTVIESVREAFDSKASRLATDEIRLD